MKSVANPVVAEISGREYEAKVTITQNTEQISSSMPTADPNWVFVDSNGHEHRYERGYPTLEKVIDEQHWCNGNEGIAPHDPHMAVDELHFECLECREVIKPGLRPPGYIETIPTTREVEVTVQGQVEFRKQTGSIAGSPGWFLPVSWKVEHMQAETTFLFLPEQEGTI